MHIYLQLLDVGSLWSFSLSYMGLLVTLGMSASRPVCCKTRFIKVVYQGLETGPEYSFWELLLRASV